MFLERNNFGTEAVVLSYSVSFILKQSSTAIMFPKTEKPFSPELELRTS
jgi:hypothetical protein